MRRNGGDKSSYMSGSWVWILEISLGYGEKKNSGVPVGGLAVVVDESTHEGKRLALIIEPELTIV